jgi:tetratricopeptide (TPR) repeat protein
MNRKTTGLLLFIIVGLGLTASSAQKSDPQTAVLPLSAKSAKVRQLLDQAWKLDLDEVEQAKAADVLRRVVALEPDFAMGHELLSQTSLDPAEQLKEQNKAFATRSHASHSEQLVIEWFQNAADHKLIPAITDMNDLLSQYPHDKWVVFLANWWLTTQTQYERAAAVYENSGIKDSPGLMNNTAYTYAYMRQFDKAFALMDKYIAALPDDANPQDSYAEILRMAGHFDEAIEHYKAALAINPEFYSSAFGIADTYSLMGDQDRARKEYEIAFHRFRLPALHQVQWETREATTYIREGDYAGADRVFQQLADYTHTHHMSQVEADTYRQMAMYQPDHARALALLGKADDAVKEARNSMPAAIKQESAQILRVRVELGLRMDDKKSTRTALARLTELSQNSSDKLIDSAFHGATGAVLFSEHNYKNAISHLEEDINNPLSLKLLALAYQKAGDAPEAKQTAETLANLNDPTLEQAMIVPAFRKCYQDPACGGSFKDASLQK